MPERHAQPIRNVENGVLALDYPVGLESAGGIPAQYVTLSRLFILHAPQSMRSLELAVAARCADAAARCAHSLQGAAAAIGGQRLASTAHRLTEAARLQLNRIEPNQIGPDWTEIDVARDQLHGELQELIELLRQTIQTLQT